MHAERNAEPPRRERGGWPRARPPQVRAAMTRCPLSKASVAGALLRQDMPFGEVRAVLDAADPAIVRRYLELHRERLEEQIVERRRALDVLERTLIDRLTSSHPATTSA